MLEERNVELNTKVKEMEMRFFDSEKAKKNGYNIHKRPFCSAVRGDARIPSLDLRSGLPGIVAGRCKCSCASIRRSDVLCEIERLSTEAQNQNEMLEALKSQLEARDREIMRLNALFTGGRPAAALAKDCCYRNVSALTEDVQYLQKEKMEYERRVAGLIEREANLTKKIMRMAEDKDKLERDFKDFEKVALEVESQANEAVLSRDREISDLKEQLVTANRRVVDMERARWKNDKNIEIIELREAFKQANEDKRQLTKQVNELLTSERRLLEENDRLKTKYVRIKARRHYDGSDKASDDIEKVQKERDFYYDEYSRLLLQTKEKAETRNVLDIAEKNIEISDLKSQITRLKSSRPPPSTGNSTEDAIAVQATLHRLERERDVALAMQQQLAAERDTIQDKLRLALEAHEHEQKLNENTVQHHLEQINQLKGEKRELMASHIPNSAAINQLRIENEQLYEKVKALEGEKIQLKISNSQIKLLLEQTEKSMSMQKNKLNHSEHHLTHVESMTQSLQMAKEEMEKDFIKLKGELTTLQATNDALEKEKDRLIAELDAKTEKIYNLESNSDVAKATKRDLQETIDKLQRKIGALNSDNVAKEGALRTATSENEVLKKQVVTLKKTCDNTLNENCRLSNELADAGADLTKEKEKVKKFIADLETLKAQLSEKKEELRRLHALLDDKEGELSNVMDNYRSVTRDAQSLEESQVAIMRETENLKSQLKEAEQKIQTLQRRTNLRADEFTSQERQIAKLSAQINSQETEIETLRTENSTLRLQLVQAKAQLADVETAKSKLIAELDSNTKLRQKLQEDLDQIKREKPITTSPDPNVINLQEILNKTRNESEQLRMSANQMTQELLRMRCKVVQLEKKYEDEHAVMLKSDALAKEYKVQVQELRRMLTDDRFTQLRSLEDTNPYPTL